MSLKQKERDGERDEATQQNRKSQHIENKCTHKIINTSSAVN